MIVELTGLPGVGKTFAESILRMRLEGLEVSTTTEDEQRQLCKGSHRSTMYGLGLPRLIPALKRPGNHILYSLSVSGRDLSNRLAGGCLFGALARWKRMPCRWLAEQMVLTSYFRTQNATGATPVFLCSEGIAHLTAAVSVWGGPRYARLVRNWIRHRNCSDIRIVLIDAPVNLALERVCKRGVPRSWPTRASRSRSSVEDVLSRFSAAIERSLEEFDRAGASVLRIDNSADEAALASQLYGLAGEISSGMLAEGHPRVAALVQ